MGKKTTPKHLNKVYAQCHECQAEVSKSKMRAHYWEVHLTPITPEEVSRLPNVYV